MKKKSKVILLPVITVLAVALSYNTWAGDSVKSGAVKSTQRFSVGTGAEADCVIDNLTNLMWVKSPPINEFNWVDTSAYAENLTLCGYSDWRLPNLNEIESLLEAAPSQEGRHSPAEWLNTQGFSNVQGRYYWSSVANVDLPARTWAVDMSYQRRVASCDRRNSNNVWPVRNTQ